ncbi:hypothetical protein T439DRAFT_352628 [Meredithblackwellia eburnea MCA 4105]
MDADKPLRHIEFGNFMSWVTLTSTGESLQVYKPSVNYQLRKVSCFIQSTDEQPFVVHVHDRGVPGTSQTDWAARILIDGIEAGHAGFNEERSFIFSKPSLTDEVDSTNTGEAAVTDLGTIQVQVCRGHAGPEIQPSLTAAPEPVVLSELATKGMISHQARLGPSRRVTPQRYLAFTYIDVPSQPYWTFEFHYMSRDLLELRGHVSAPAAPIIPVASFEPEYPVAGAILSAPPSARHPASDTPAHAPPRLSKRCLEDQLDQSNKELKRLKVELELRERREEIKKLRAKLEKYESGEGGNDGWKVKKEKLDSTFSEVKKEKERVVIVID